METTTEYASTSKTTADLISIGGWISTADELPPEGVLVQVPNNNGARLRRQGNLWFLPRDFTTYVYYTPEYWRHMA